MKERPILMSAPMVLACLREVDPKTNTRRGIRPQPDWLPEVHSVLRTDGVFFPLSGEGRGHQCGAPIVSCPYGVPGDRIWVREAWRVDPTWDKTKPSELPPDGSIIRCEAHAESSAEGWGKLRPGMFMPRWASRLTLQITDVRVERLNDCSWEDAIAEGVETSPDDPGLWLEYGTPSWDDKGVWLEDPRRSYRSLWEQINGPGSWAANPWVWVVAFERV